MQIHELTKLLQQTNEGLLDNFKDAVTAAKTGYAAGKAGTGSTLGAAGTALGTFGKAITSPGFAAQSDKDANKDAAMKKYNDLKAKYGWADKPAAGATPQAGQPAQANPQQAQQQVQAMVQQFTQDPMFVDLTAVLPDPGQLLQVDLPNPQGSPAEYFKDESGTWKNKDGTPVKGSSVKKLESMIDADQYKQVSAAAMGGGQQQNQQQDKAKNKAGATAQQPATPTATPAATPTATPAATAPAQQNESLSEAAGNRKVNNILKKIIQKNRAAEQAVEKAKANPKTAPVVDQAYNKVLAAAAQTRAQAPSRQAKATNVKRAFTNYAKQVVQASNAAPAGDQAQPGAEQNAMAANPAAQQAATAKLAVQGLDKPTIEKVKQVAKKDPATVKQAIGLEEQLQSALATLNESQVHITKDIVIRTTKGNYTKRASDQTWYDPNGVAIDPTKYADYVAKLDATPQAQTQYQADAQKAAAGKGPGGTDAAAQQPPAPPPPPSAPQAAAPADNPVNDYVAQQQMLATLRASQIKNHNAMVTDTMNQLRNAEIFGTGQKDYLQQRLVQLIATKF